MVDRKNKFDFSLFTIDSFYCKIVLVETRRCEKSYINILVIYSLSLFRRSETTLSRLSGNQNVKGKKLCRNLHDMGSLRKERLGK